MTEILRRNFVKKCAVVISACVALAGVAGCSGDPTAAESESTDLMGEILGDYAIDMFAIRYDLRGKRNI